MRTFNVGVIGATGMVGQRFLRLLDNHPWFNVTVLAASERSANKTYFNAVGNKWAFDCPIPEKYAQMLVLDAEKDIELIAKRVDFVFCAVNMDKTKIRALEEKYAKMEIPVVSNNSAHRFTPDVPMVIPEINPEHVEVIPAQRRRLGTKRGFIAVKSNCSLQSYVPLLHPLKKFGIKSAAVCTYQAISGAGKTFQTMPEILDNVIPYIGGEEEKSENEPLKIWGELKNGEIVGIDCKTELCYEPTAGEYTEYNITLTDTVKLRVNEKLEEAQDYEAPEKLEEKILGVIKGGLMFMSYFIL